MNLKIILLKFLHELNTFNLLRYMRFVLVELQDFYKLKMSNVLKKHFENPSKECFDIKKNSSKYF